MQSIRPALIVVDMQNAFCSPSGTFAKLGYAVQPLRKVIPTILKLLDAAREFRLPVIFTRSVYRTDYSDGGILLDELFPEVKQWKGVTAGSWDAEILRELGPQPGEIVIEKNRYSAFFRTPLEESLRRLQADTIVLCGVTTSACVESTARDACFRDFRVCVVADASSEVNQELHDAALKTVQLWFGYVLDSCTAIELLRQRTFSREWLLSRASSSF